jgi:hypothetical protein
VSDPVRPPARSGSFVSNEPWGRTYRESAGWFGIAAGWWVGFVLLAVVLGLGYMWFVRPSMLNAERVGNQQSQQYEATQVAGMRTDFDTVVAMDREIQQYQAQPASPERDRLIAADHGQRTNALNDIKRKRDLMPDKSKVPDDIAAYLSRTGN